MNANSGDRSSQTLLGDQQPALPKDVPVVLQGDQQKLHDELMGLVGDLTDAVADYHGPHGDLRDQQNIRVAQAALSSRIKAVLAVPDGVPDTSGGKANG